MNACQFELELIGFLREEVLGLTTEDGGVIGDSTGGPDVVCVTE